MLDFYLLRDDQNIQKEPDHSLQFAGRLDLKTFSNLQQKGVIAERFDYFTDFRWGTTLILQMQQTIEQRQLQRDTDVKQLINLLDQAQQNQAGLFALSD